MANDEHVAILKKGVAAWDAWRAENPGVLPDLSRANLSGADLSGANLSRANLDSATLVRTDLTDADLTACRIYGVSAWGLKLERTQQQNLVITPTDEPTVTVDNIEVAQFIYLLLRNQKIRDVIDTIGKKGVLLLGRFTEGRMVVLERLREKLRSLGARSFASWLCGLRRMFRRSSSAVATSREGHRPPRSGPAVLHRRWGLGRQREFRLRRMRKEAFISARAGPSSCVP
jgi:Pentapeptide repeats (8 copies)